MDNLEFTTKCYEIDKAIMKLQDDKRELIRKYNQEHKK